MDIASMDATWPDHYFLPRDFEMVQPLYDLAFLLQTAPRGKGETAKYRAASLHKAACSLDGYSNLICRWLKGDLNDALMDARPSSRIKGHLLDIFENGRLTERDDRWSASSRAGLKLRSIRGLGNKMITAFYSESSHGLERWLEEASQKSGFPAEHILSIIENRHFGRWQAAHVVPPLLRLLRSVETKCKQSLKWSIPNLKNGLQPVDAPFTVHIFPDNQPVNLRALKRAVTNCLFFSVEKQAHNHWILNHALGWHFHLTWDPPEAQQCPQGEGRLLRDLAEDLDPLLGSLPLDIRSDLHMHTRWSDGLATLGKMAVAAMENGRQYLAITDHSRSCKMQGELTPAVWIKQAMALNKSRLPIPVLHGLEVDILPDGSLDAPAGILGGMDLVVASIHSGLNQSRDRNTARLIKAVESGRIDIIGHPGAQLLGKQGIPQFKRPPLDVDWDALFDTCARMEVALEINCFPARLDLGGDLLAQAIAAGCLISLGSDAHATSHLHLINFGAAMLAPFPSVNLLNKLTYGEMKHWLKSARATRSKALAGGLQRNQAEPEKPQIDDFPSRRPITAHISSPRWIPAGSKVVGLDLTAGQNRKTGVAQITGHHVETLSLSTDEELLDYVRATRPAVVGIDSPLGLPGGGDQIDPEAGIVRAAEQELSSIGIPSYPALIDSMKNLTLRGIKLRREMEALDHPPVVIESYPGGAQDILSIPRKQKGLELLRAGLKEMGLEGPGLDTSSHDEMDAITAALVGRYYESGDYEALGTLEEAQLIMPKVRLLEMSPNPVIILTGKSGTGKSVIGRYLALTYGFLWLKSNQLTPDEIAASIANSKVPAVVDGLYNPLPPLSTNRPLYSWYVDCPDSIIRKRSRNKPAPNLSGKTPESRTGDHGERLGLTPSIRIENHGTLEKLHWRVDDALFDIISIQRERDDT